MHILFIAGIPGSGKTRFGDWLRDNKGYVHIDMECFNDPALHQKWDACFASGNFEPFIAEILIFPKPVVLTWGFPPRHLPIIHKLHKLGVHCFWFDAPEMLARDSFLNRNTAPESDFDRQIEEIRKNQKAILSFFDERCVTVMLGRRRYLDPNAIFNELESQNSRNF